MATGASSSEEQAALLAEQGEFAAAICRYKVTIAERPDCAKLFEQLAQCLLETEQYPEAYQAASEALNLAPQWPEALLTLARCSFNTGLLPDANHQFSQYLDMQPHDVEVQAELAEVKHLQQQQLALAVGLPGLQIEQSYGAQGGPGHVVWEAGLVLSRYFVSHPELVRGKRVLELGCGTGVVGITLACLGADVTLTDIAAIVPHTKYNLQCNRQLIQSGHGKAAEAALDWNSPSSSQSLLAKQYDLLVGADLIYAAKDMSPLTDTLQQLRQHSSDCPLTIAHKIRSLPATNQFLAQLRQVGCSLHEAETDGAVCIYISEIVTPQLPVNSAMLVPRGKS
ncbi:TPA: Protein-lysine N-methyltransferase rrg1 [Trebouxia sp. C0006]